MRKFTEKFKSFFSSDVSLQRIPLYFFITCILLVVLIFKLGETNIYLQEIAANGTNSIELETDANYKDVADVFIEPTKNPEEILPILGETTTEKAKEESSTENKSDNEAVNKNNEKTTYVLNINSKKIHLADCSFVERTKEENKRVVELTDEELELYYDDGYTLCKTCGGK